MSAFVIDGKKKRQYITVFVVSIIISFALGFTSGYFTNLSPESQSFDQLKSQIYDESEIANEEHPQDESRPDQPAASTGEAENKPVEQDKQGDTPAKKTETGAEKARVANSSATEKPAAPVNTSKAAAVKAEARPEVKAAAVTRPQPKPEPSPQPKPEPSPQPKPKPKPLPVPTPEPEPQPVVKPQAAMTGSESEAPAAAAPMRPPEQQAPTAPPDSLTENLPVAASLSPAEPVQPPQPASQQKVFAVQVGLFVNRDNAQKLVYELLDKGYDAYMDEFQASDGDIKYNVRFGRFVDRASVQSKLAEYKREYASPAYIIITK